MAIAKKPTTVPRKYISIDDAANYLSLHVNTVWILIRNKSLKSYAMGPGGRARRLEMTEVEAYAQKRRMK